jgi:DNA-binding MarR family transcriptional regulator
MAETGADLERRHQLTLSAYDALQMLAWAGADGMTIGELSERVLLSPSGISRVVDRLEREGFVERRPGSRDTRQRIARVTAAGLEKLVAATPDHLDAIQAGFLDHLTVEETRVLAKALAKTARRGGPAAVGPEVSP